MNEYGAHFFRKYINILGEDEQQELPLGLLDNRKTFRHEDLAWIIDSDNLEMAYAVELGAKDLAEKSRRKYENLTPEQKEKYLLKSYYEIDSQGGWHSPGMPKGWLPD
jgi:hypothetical protein